MGGTKVPKCNENQSHLIRSLRIRFVCLFVWVGRVEGQQILTSIFPTGQTCFHLWCRGLLIYTVNDKDSLGFECQQACECITSSLHLFIHLCIYPSTVKYIQYLDSGIELLLPSQLENNHYGPVHHMFSSVTNSESVPTSHH